MHESLNGLVFTPYYNVKGGTRSIGQFDSAVEAAYAYAMHFIHQERTAEARREASRRVRDAQREARARSASLLR